MSRVIPGIKGVPFSKIVERESYATRPDWVVEVMSCGHTNTVERDRSFGVTIEA